MPMPIPNSRQDHNRQHEQQMDIATMRAAIGYHERELERRRQRTYTAMNDNEASAQHLYATVLRANHACQAHERELARLRKRADDLMVWICVAVLVLAFGSVSSYSTITDLRQRISTLESLHTPD